MITTVAATIHPPLSPLSTHLVCFLLLEPLCIYISFLFLSFFLCLSPTHTQQIQAYDSPDHSVGPFYDLLLLILLNVYPFVSINRPNISTTVLLLLLLCTIQQYAPVRIFNDNANSYFCSTYVCAFLLNNAHCPLFQVRSSMSLLLHPCTSRQICTDLYRSVQTTATNQQGAFIHQRISLTALPYADVPIWFLRYT